MKNEDTHSRHELDIYVTGLNDQPTTCPKCGGRTDFMQIDVDIQEHKCLECGYEFFMDFEEDNVPTKSRREGYNPTSKK